MKPKKKLGIIGGMGSHATLWFFQRLISLTTAEKDQDYPEIVIHNNSKIPDRTQSIINGGESPLAQLRESVALMNQSGVDIAVMACMTAYYYYPELVNSFKGKLLHPLELVARELLNNPVYLGKKKIGVIATTGFITSGLLHQELEPAGFDIVCLDPHDQEKYFMQPLYRADGIKSGCINEEIRTLFHYQVPLLREKGAEVIIGACSEVPLLINSTGEIPFIDAIELLAVKALEHYYSPAGEFYQAINSDLYE